MLRSFRLANHRSFRHEQELLLTPSHNNDRDVVPVAAWRCQAVEAIVLARGAAQRARSLLPRQGRLRRRERWRCAPPLTASLGDLTGQRYGHVSACPPLRAAPQCISTPRPRSIASTGCDQAGLSCTPILPLELPDRAWSRAPCMATLDQVPGCPFTGPVELGRCAGFDLGGPRRRVGLILGP